MVKLVLDSFLCLGVGHLRPVLMHSFSLWTECPYLFLIGVEGLDELLGRGIVENKLVGNVLGLHLCHLFAAHTLFLTGLLGVGLLCRYANAEGNHHDGRQQKSKYFLHCLIRLSSYLKIVLPDKPRAGNPDRRC